MTKILVDNEYLRHFDAKDLMVYIEIEDKVTAVKMSDLKVGRKSSEPFEEKYGKSNSKYENVESYAMFTYERDVRKPKDAQDMCFYVPKYVNGKPVSYDYMNYIPVQSSKIVAVKPIMYDYESTTMLPEDIYGKQSGENIVAVGSKRTVEMKDFNSVSTGNNYMLVKVKGIAKPVFVKKQDILYYADNNQYTYTRVQNDLSAGYTFYASTDNAQKEIEWIRSGYEYVPTRLKNYQTVENHKLVNVSLDENGNELTREIVKDLATTISVQTPVTITQPSQTNADETVEVKKIKVENYATSNNGNYIKVKPKNYSAEIVVNIANLLDSAKNSINVSDLNNFIGKSLFVKIGEDVLELESLTEQQAKVRFKSCQNYQESYSVDDINGDKTYLRLRNGKYVKEKLVTTEPICYRFATSTDKHDAYVVVADDGSTHVVPYNAFDHRDMIYTENDHPIALRKSKATRIKRTADYSTCDVVQTTSANKKTESCKVVSTIPGHEYLEVDNNKNQVLEQEKTAFQKAYKKGEYKLNEVVVDGKIERLETKNKRYIYSNSILVDDVASDTLRYKALKSTPLKMQLDKSGKAVVGLQGGPKYDIGKGITSMYKKWGKALLYYGNIAFSGLGLITLAVAPGFAIASAAVMVASPIAIPVVNLAIGGTERLFRKVTSVAKGSFWKSKAEIRQKSESKAIKKEMQRILTSVKEYSKEKDINDIKDRVLADIFNVEQTLISISDTRWNSNFIFDGETADVNENNIHSYEVWRKQVLPLINQNQKDLNAIEKAKQKLEALEKKYGSNPTASQKQKLERCREIYYEAKDKQSKTEAELIAKKKAHLTGSEIKGHKKVLQQQETIACIKGFIMAKYFGRLDLVETLDLDKLDYDMGKGFIYQGQVVDMTQDNVIVNDIKKLKEFGKQLTTAKDMQQEIVEETENVNEQEVAPIVEEQVVVEQDVQHLVEQNIEDDKTLNDEETKVSIDTSVLDRLIEEKKLVYEQVSTSENYVARQQYALKAIQEELIEDEKEMSEIEKKIEELISKNAPAKKIEQLQKEKFQLEAKILRYKEIEHRRQQNYQEAVEIHNQELQQNGMPNITAADLKLELDNLIEERNNVLQTADNNAHTVQNPTETAEPKKDILVEMVDGFKPTLKQDDVKVFLTIANQYLLRKGKVDKKVKKFIQENIHLLEDAVRAKDKPRKGWITKNDMLEKIIKTNNRLIDMGFEASSIGYEANESVSFIPKQ
ncbi:MAG: hypothetical protein IKM43_00970 [Clostridia bacterium]|nr:hypothetical protein [Clostridia bacterium]